MLHVWNEPMPSYRDEGEINRFKKQIADLERELLAWKKARDAEVIKRRALEKLTPEERKVLGLESTD